MHSFYMGIYNYSVLVLVFFAGLRLIGMQPGRLPEYRGPQFNLAALLLCVAYCVLWATRPVEKFPDDFADSIGYFNSYAAMSVDWDSITWDGEYCWATARNFARMMGLTPMQWLIAIDIVQFATLYFVCKRFFGNMAGIGALFFLCSFGFSGFAYNGLRIGLASNFFLLGLSYLDGSKRGWIICAIWLVIAFGFHKSTSITLMGLALAIFLYRRIELAILLWIVCVALSFMLGRFMDTFLMDLFEDDKLNAYLTTRHSTKLFSRVGFRWDFLLYSLWPMAFGYWIIRFKGVTNSAYSLIYTIYVVTNAFWVLVIQASYSNRFAGLSWFLIPIIFAYPFFRLRLDQFQNRTAAITLYSVEAFSFIMFLLGK